MNLKYLVNWVNLASRMLLYTGNPHSWLWKAVWIILITFWCPRESGVFDPVYEDTVNHKLLLSWFLIFDANLMAVCYSVNKQGKNLRWFWYLFCRLENKRLIIVCAHMNNIQSLHTYLTIRQINALSLSYKFLFTTILYQRKAIYHNLYLPFFLLILSKIISIIDKTIYCTHFYYIGSIYFGAIRFIDNFCSFAFHSWHWSLARWHPGITANKPSKKQRKVWLTVHLSLSSSDPFCMNWYTKQVSPSSNV